MRGAELLAEGFGRISEEVHAAAEGLRGERLGERLDPEANSIAWLVWHLSRVQDDHVADAAGEEQVWTGAGWAERLGLPFPDEATGYGMSAAEVGRVRVSGPGDLLGYFDAVHARTLAYVSGLSDGDFDRVVDENWSPPVTLGVRLVSVLSDCLQHAGQAAYVRGALERR
ncbi:mycothiol transferase [Streptomyces sp. SPB074]|uniref:mycothiol transferase n=1 Tax=Streptomyces sp. (strain SPB074) TaxID=465543 RepID=UPI00017F19EB|nr:DUF664 domain-containing protein [Streptomyces sp. SPB074]EDY46204.1 conserved hypothetical protein [Streptomyces sp. SPB074]